MIKKDGKLVYATCSILPSENELQIDKFLKSEIGKDFKKEDEKKISPNQTGFDGFYMALLERKEAVLKPKEIFSYLAKNNESWKTLKKFPINSLSALTMTSWKYLLV